MRARPVIALSLVAASVTAATPAAAALGGPAERAGGVVLAQQEESEEQGGGGGDPGEESGAGEGETEGSTSETGPPWTYQMARLSTVLLVGLLLSIGWVYYKLVVKRRRGET